MAEKDKGGMEDIEVPTILLKSFDVKDLDPF
jgi:hypothetical protein